MTTQGTTTSAFANVSRIGLDIWPFGRVFRIVAGLFLVAVSVVEVSTDDADTRTVTLAAGYFFGLTLFYLVLYHLLGERVLSRADPFVGTALVFGPLLLLGFAPDPMHVAISAYIGASLVLAAIMRYGGCELVALPTLLYGRRYTVYCTTNIVDVAERPLHGTGDPVLRAAGVFALVIAVFYLLVDPLLDEYVARNIVSRWWALLLLIPAAIMVRRAFQYRSDRGRAFALALGAAGLVAGVVILTGVASDHTVFAVVVLGGLLLLGYRAIVRARNR